MTRTRGIRTTSTDTPPLYMSQTTVRGFCHDIAAVHANTVDDALVSRPLRIAGRLHRHRREGYRPAFKSRRVKSLERTPAIDRVLSSACARRLSQFAMVSTTSPRKNQAPWTVRRSPPRPVCEALNAHVLTTPRLRPLRSAGDRPGLGGLL